jgi:poly(A) polymerase
MTARLDPAKQPWMADEPAQQVMRALKAEGGEARFVGGAVRNALLGEPVTDVDIATPVRPDDVMRLLAQAGLGIAPTGIAHGTVTAIAGGKPFEVTTLRRDVSTDGRRAVVAFSSDWKEDAARRDFTINALYADESGNVFDYFGGAGDLTARHVRFVGDPSTRIREDYLRILRLFRFHAWYGKGEIDSAALAASVALKDGLKRLSGERVQKELLRLLEARDPVPVLSVMEGSGILAQILPGRLQLARASNLIALQQALSRAPDPLLRLAALIPNSADHARAIAAALRLSNHDRDRLIDAASPDEAIGPALSRAELHKHIYRAGTAPVCDQFLLRWADSGASADDPNWRTRLTEAESWQRPLFSLDGEDVMAAGVAEGPRIGAVLREVEQWWIAADFTPDRPALLARLRQIEKGRSQ